jgi:hypothetical protein
MLALLAMFVLSPTADAMDATAVHAAMDAEAGWTRVQERDGVTVYRKSIPGLDIDAFKGIKTLDPDVDPALMFRLICDVSAHVKYSPALAETGLIQESATGMTYYQVMKSPPLLPVAPRYWVNTAAMEYDVDGEAGRNRRRWSSLPLDQLPEIHARIKEKHEGAVLVAFTHGVWDLDPEPDGTTTVRYYQVSHPGGRIPDSLAAGLSGRTLPNTIERFEDAARRP